ncbi:MAG: hypothetical protein WBA10_13185 [Elainellaceae cyanobacterium]
MDPVTLSLSAVAAVMVLKMAEKTGESLSEITLAQVGTLVNLLKSRFPAAATTLEALPAGTENPFDYGAAAKQLEGAIAADAEVAQAAEAVDQAVKADPMAKQQAEKLARSPQVVNNAKLAEEIKAVFQGNVIQSQTNNF